MPETGNNISANKKILSIRLTSSGLSFYAGASGQYSGEGERRFSFAQRETGPAMAVRNILDTTPELSGYFSAVNVFIDTMDTVYVPDGILTGDNAVAFLSDAGVCLTPGDGVAISPAVGEVRAAMKYEAGVLKYLRDFYGAKLSFYSPLQENLRLSGKVDASRGGFVVNITERNIYITRFGDSGRLLVSEVYPYDTDADIVFYLYHLVDAAGVRNPRIRVFGPGAKAHCKVIKKYFSCTSCV